MQENHTITQLHDHLQSIRVQMMSLLTVTRKIGYQDSIDDLYEFYEESLTDFLEVEDICLFTLENEWKQVLCKSVHLSPPNRLNTHIAYQYRQPSILSDDISKELGGYRYIIPVYYNSSPISYTLLGAFKSGSDNMEADFLLYAKTLINILTIVIENKKLINKELQKKDLEKDLELAHKIQGMLIPTRLPKNSMYEFAGLYLPHRSIGGDYYDVININKDEFIFCIGDISGKGVSAALVMASLQAYLNAGIDIDLKDCRELVDRLNDKIYNITKGEKFITLFLAKYNILTRELQYLNAGHNPPFLVHGSQIKRLKKGCSILGVLDHIPKVETESIILKKDAFIFTYTDGLSEQTNLEGEAFGEERILQYIQSKPIDGMQGFVEGIYSDMNLFKGKQEIGDDISILAGRFY